jgi:hypothetical protein
MAAKGEVLGAAAGLKCKELTRVFYRPPMRPEDVSPDYFCIFSVLCGTACMFMEVSTENHSVFAQFL